MLNNVAAVVVHHRSYATVGMTVRKLLEQDIPIENILVVDNSEQQEMRKELSDSLPVGIATVFVDNKGYGAAVNVGISYFAQMVEPKPEFFLVATHETRPEPGAVEGLVGALDDPEVAVAGPTLVSGAEPEFVWSAGGYLAPRTRIPSHYHHRVPIDDLSDYDEPVDREWLDGAFLLYRWQDIERHRIDESYFLYMEETDLHLRLAKHGRKVVWVPASRVWQDSRGIPPYYLARNLRLLFKEHESPLHRFAVVPFAVAKRLCADIVRRQDFSGVLPSLHGLVAKLPGTGIRKPLKRVNVLNPLGAALRHYESEVVSVLSERQVEVQSTRILEPSASGRSSVAWLIDYLSKLSEIRRASSSRESGLLVLWPVLGYWDIVLMRVLGMRRATLVMHDPRPLVKAVGYSPFARVFASAVSGSIRILVHSEKAAKVLNADAPQLTVSLIPHPILEFQETGATRDPAKPIVRVLGQFKRDRDLDALREIGRSLGDTVRMEIHGRGWPEVEGWSVTPGFVTEDRLAELMAGSSAVVIPYSNFFQSGIAIRALELGVPFVGPRESVLAEMVGQESKLLVSEGPKTLWTDAVNYAITAGPPEAASAAELWRRQNLTAWSRWLDTR